MGRFASILLVVLTFVAAVVGSALPAWLGRGTSMTVNSVTGANEVQRRIDVSGSGVVYAVPDQASVQIGVTSQAASASDALKDNSAKTSAVIETIKSLGVDAKDIQTRNFSIYPTYDDKGLTVTGYQVSNAVVVLIRDVQNAGAILDKVVASGANNISGLSFDVADPTAQQAEARAKAVEVARAKAETLAKAAGVTLGDIITINESVSSSGPIMPYARADVAMAEAVPMATGQQAITVDVMIAFAIR